jgi:hypothetical protein
MIRRSRIRYNQTRTRPPGGSTAAQSWQARSRRIAGGHSAFQLDADPTDWEAELEPLLLGGQLDHDPVFVFHEGHGPATHECGAGSIEE